VFGFFITWFIILLAVVLIFLFSNHDQKLQKVLFIALGVRLALMIIDAYIWPGLPYLTAADASRFQRRAIAFSELGLSELITWPLPGGAGLFAYFMGTVYALLGTDESTVIRAINITAGVFAIYNAYHISRMLWTRKIALQNAMILAFFPLLAVYAQNLLREAFVVYFLTLGVRYYVSWVKHRRIHHIAIAVVGFGLSTALHMVALMALLGLVIYQAWLVVQSLAKGRIITFLSSIVAIMIVGVGLHYLNSTGWGLSTIGGEGAIGEFGVEELIEERGGDQRKGRASYLQGLTASNPVDVIWQTPLRGVFFLFSPMPWMVNSFWDLVGLMDGLLYFLIFFGIYKSFPVIRKDPAALAVLVMLLGMIVAFAWGVTNYGTGMRHRAKIIILAVCLAPYLIPLRKLVQSKVKKGLEVVYTSRILHP
jgi:4-amino-4-deoxy-L-arabinose transferase-like glycosyltransferase